jgi:Uma2 family endonuclease
MATTAHLTIDDFERLPLERAKNHELIDGELIEMPGNTLYHNAITMVLISLLLPIIQERRLGRLVVEQEYGFGGNAHGPDISFFGRAKEAFADPDKRVQRFVPDRAVEIVSANDTFASILRQKERYRTCGTGEVWVVVPETREVLVYSANGDRILRGDAELSTDLLPGLRIAVRQLFEDAKH